MPAPHRRRPTFFATEPGCFARSENIRLIPALFAFATGPSSQTTSSALRPCMADQVLSAITATPFEICVTISTPRTAFAFSILKPRTLPPNTGQRTSDAYFMPGTRASRPNRALPFTLSRVSSRFIDLPIRRKSFGSFSATPLGTGSFAAASESSP